ncbi:MAG: ABC transporter substrate binding protein [Myxococcota bacterium]|jgi:putative ABC transport system substrate-binding protein|nr:ABC transporter substrate binding protein [Myxococcota bacterium]
MAALFHPRRGGSLPAGAAPRRLLLCGIAALALGLGGASPSTAAAEPSTRDRFEQAKHYYKRGLPREALQALKPLLATQQGRENPKVQLLAAQLYRDRGEIDLAFRAVSKAREFGSATDKEEADQLYKALTRAFGEVRILPQGGVHVKGRIFLDTAEEFINVERKNTFKAVQRSLLVRPRQYPDSIWIPYGEYRANGVAFRHEQGGRSEAVVPFPQIAILRSASGLDDKELIGAFRTRVGGVTTVYTLEGDADRLAALVDTIRGKKPDLLVAFGRGAALVGRRELRKVPLLFGLFGGNPLGNDLPGAAELAGVSSLQAPGETVKWIRTLVPRVRRVGVLYDPQRSTPLFATVRDALEAAGLTPIAAEVRRTAELGATLALHRARVDVWWTLGDVPLASPEAFQQLVAEQLGAGKPLVAGTASQAAQGAFLAVEGDPKTVGIQLSNQARRLLCDKVAASEIGIEPPQQLAVHLNRAVAEKLSLLPAAEVQQRLTKLHDRLPAGATE